MEHAKEKQTFFNRIIGLISRIGADSNESKDLKLKKLLFVGSVLFLATPPSTLIGTLIWFFGSSLIGGSYFYLRD